MKNSLLLVLGFICLQVFESCDAPCGDDPNFDADFYIHFDLPRITPDFHRDSVQIFFQNGDLTFPGPVDAGGDILFSRYNSFDKKIPVDTIISESYFLRVIRNGINVDTFRLEYLAQMIDDRCYDKEFVFIDLYFNDSLVYQNNNWRLPIYIHL